MKISIRIDDPNWPVAICPALICDEFEKFERADGIIEEFLKEDRNRKILDYGCGEGHLVFQIKKHNPEFVIGYDIKSTQNDLWKHSQYLTTDFEIIKKTAPYDIIIINDVIDHSANEIPEMILKNASSVLKDDGKIILICHPWYGRYGGHLHTKINKAYAHLMLSLEELDKIGFNIEEYNRVFPALIYYKNWIKNASLYIEREEVEKKKLEDYFYQEEIKKIILKSILIYENKNFPFEELEKNFFIFILRKNPIFKYFL